MLLTAVVNCDAMMVSCQSSFLCRLQLVSRHVIEVQEIGFKSLVQSSGEVGLQQILAGNVITCLEPLINIGGGRYLRLGGHR